LDVPVLGSKFRLSVASSNSSTSYSICGKQFLQVQPNAPWNNQTCTIFVEYAVNQTNKVEMGKRSSLLSYEWELPPATYFIVVKANKATNITLDFSWDACPAGSWGPDCTLRTSDYYTTTILLNSTNADYYEYPISTFSSLRAFSTYKTVQSLGLSMQILNHTKASVDFNLFFGNIPLSPSSGIKNAPVNNQTTTEVSLSLPSIGDYLIKLQVNNTKLRSRRVLESDFPLRFLLNVTTNFCVNGTFGDPCQVATRVNQTAPPTVSDTTVAGTWRYFVISAVNSTVPFNISIQNTDGSQTNAPALFLRYKQAPSAQEYDAKSNGSMVNSIASGMHSNGTWVVGILGTGVGYSVWFNSPCPNNCAGNGNCAFVKGAYQCTCNDGYQSFDCSQKKDSGFKTEYIVLIVIGSIIALAAVLGFIVYLYNRNRHPGGGYEKI